MKFNNLSCDLTAMFIRHCPDLELSFIFKCKLLQQWTVTDVHEKLVEHSRDQKQVAQLRVAAAVAAQWQEVDSHIRNVTTDIKHVTAPSPSQQRDRSA